MTPSALACRISERINAAVAHPLSFPAFVVGVAVAWLALGLDATNFAISILTAGLLFLMATADLRRSAKIEREVDELARVHPDIDESAINEEAGR